MYRTMINSITTAAMALTMGIVLNTATLADPAQKIALPEDPAEQVTSLNDADRREISFIARAHVAALSSRNADILYQLAAPELRAKFRNAGHMLKVFSVLHGPFTIAKGVRMDGLSALNPDRPVQYVYVTDRMGRLWWAALMVTKSDGGSWHIRNCLIVRAPGVII